MLSTTVLLAAAAILFVCWAALGTWALAERYLHDRFDDLAQADASGYLDGRLDLVDLGSRRLTRIALGPSSPAAAAAAGVLAGRSWSRLTARAAGTGSRDSRLRAFTILVRSGFPDALRLIRAAVAQGDPALTTSLLRIAGELQTELTDSLLLDVLVDGVHPRARTATELEPRAERLHERLTELASDDDPGLRYWAITLLKSQMRNATVALAAASRAGDDDPNVRAAVAEALGGVSARTAARPILRRLLQDETFYVRSHAARSVARVNDAALAAKLLPLLADRNWWVRAAAKDSLLQLGDKGLDTARKALSHKDAFARDGALEIILGSGRLDELVAAAADGDVRAAETVAIVRARTDESHPLALHVVPAIQSDRQAAA
jgi:HEAT repeat protein